MGVCSAMSGVKNMGNEVICHDPPCTAVEITTDPPTTAVLPVPGVPCANDKVCEAVNLATWCCLAADVANNFCVLGDVGICKIDFGWLHKCSRTTQCNGNGKTC